jgi:hypothetical protein
MAGVPQRAADLLQRPRRQPWANTGRILDDLARINWRHALLDEIALLLLGGLGITSFCGEALATGPPPGTKTWTAAIGILQPSWRSSNCVLAKAPGCQGYVLCRALFGAKRPLITG